MSIERLRSEEKIWIAFVGAPDAGQSGYPPYHIPDEVRRKVVKLALQETELSPRKLAVTFTDRESFFQNLRSTGPSRRLI